MIVAAAVARAGVHEAIVAVVMDRLGVSGTRRGQGVLAVPVGPARTLRNFADAEQVLCVRAVSRLRALGYHCTDFSATTDQEAIALLDDR